MPIAAAYGIDPLLFLVAATSLPKTEYGPLLLRINGAPIEVFTSEVRDCRCRRGRRSCSKLLYPTTFAGDRSAIYRLLWTSSARPHAGGAGSLSTTRP
jgi:hypothetical protein